MKSKHCSQHGHRPKSFAVSSSALPFTLATDATGAASSIRFQHINHDGGEASCACAVVQGLAAKQHSGFERFVCGLMAGTLAKLGTHPLDVVKKRYQIAGLQRDLRYRCILGCPVHDMHITDQQLAPGVPQLVRYAKVL